MTPFKALLNSTGLSTREAGIFLNVFQASVKGWNIDKYNAPKGALEEILLLVQAQNSMTENALEVIDGFEEAETIEIEFCCDDHEAQGLGLPCKSAHDAVIRRTLEYAEHPLKIRLVPHRDTNLAETITRLRK